MFSVTKTITIIWQPLRSVISKAATRQRSEMPSKTPERQCPGLQAACEGRKCAARLSLGAQRVKGRPHQNYWRSTLKTSAEGDCGPENRPVTRPVIQHAEGNGREPVPQAVLRGDAWLCLYTFPCVWQTPRNIFSTCNLIFGLASFPSIWWNSLVSVWFLPTAWPCKDKSKSWPMLCDDNCL